MRSGLNGREARSRRQWLASALSMFAATPSLATALDVLRRPAVRFPRVAQSVLLGISRAGSRLVAVGERGIVVLSDDDGRTWRQSDVPVSVTLTSVHFINEKRGWAVGHGGVVIVSADAGESWSLQMDGNRIAQLTLSKAQQLPAGSHARERQLADAKRMVDDGPDKPFLSVMFRDERNGMIGGAFGMLFETQDGGTTWSAIGDRLDNPRGKHLYDIRQISSAIYIAGEQGAVFRSENLGLAFETIAMPYQGTFFGVVSSGPAGGKGVIAFGLRGHAFRSLNGRSDWVPMHTNTSSSLVAGLSFNDGSALLADETGKLFRASESSIELEPMAVTASMAISSLAATGVGVLVLTGNRGVSRQLLTQSSKPTQ